MNASISANATYVYDFVDLGFEFVNLYFQLVDANSMLSKHVHANLPVILQLSTLILHAYILQLQTDSAIAT